MNEPNSESPAPRHSCVSDSPNTEYFYDDGEGDTTVRPIPPNLLTQAIAEREKIRASLATQRADHGTAEKQ
jgi:hypothetical protein